MAQRETENNAYAKFWGDKQRALWYVMVFLVCSIDNSLENNTRSELGKQTIQAKKFYSVKDHY